MFVNGWSYQIRMINLIILMLMSIVMQAQSEKLEAGGRTINKDLFYANNTHKYWRVKKLDSAVSFAQKLSVSNQSLFIDVIHNRLAPDLLQERTGASEFLTKLYANRDKKVNEIVTPIYLWYRLRTSNSLDKKIFHLKNLKTHLKNNLSDNRSALYTLKALKEIEQNVEKNDKVIEDLYLDVVNVYQKELDKVISISNKESVSKRAYARSILANAYFGLHLIRRTENSLKMAAFYSPDKLDVRNVGAYLKVYRFLYQKRLRVGFKMDYVDYLSKKLKLINALEIMAGLVINEPTDENLRKLKLLFLNVYPDGDFKVYWSNVFSEYGENFPLKEVEKILSLEGIRAKWIFIDFWGTWCSPCLDELPKVQRLYQLSKEKYSKDLDVFTVSYKSKNLARFIDSNNYTFPVKEIDEKGLETLGINSFPTKILISPEGKFRILPLGFGIDWVEYVNNYCLLNKSF